MKSFNLKTPMRSSNQKGQVALFVALIFQVLFVFFAMIVNVGLLVHHKINLQNSVDLAAYYGAMKQAEMLNAIGHVNYQIRQSWKLLNFRYNLMGGAGDIQHNPYKPSYATGGERFDSDDDTEAAHATVFCIPFTPVKDIVTATETYCQNASGAVSIPIPQTPTPVGGPGSDLWDWFNTRMNAAAASLRVKAQLGCREAMAANWLQLTKELLLYKRDLRNRKQLLLGLANSLSLEDPLDIDGESIKKGVFQTLKRNLTIPNQEGPAPPRTLLKIDSSDAKMEFKYLNSLSMPDCGSTGGEIDVPHWLAEVFIAPHYLITDANCADPLNIKFSAANYNRGDEILVPANAIDVYTRHGEMGLEKLKELAELASESSPPTSAGKLWRTSMGFEKNPWCLVYTGVSAKTTPKIPFSPLGDVTLTAKAFAKPFGGRIGPWYEQKWQHGWPTSGNSPNPDEMMDKNLPFRVEAGIPIPRQSVADIRTKKGLAPNHSRYLGDAIGLKSKLTMGQFERAVLAHGPIDLNWFLGAFKDNFDSESCGGGACDVLAYDSDAGQSPPLRDVEISAIAPDQFDIANYSIDPDFYNNYLIRIKKGYQQNLGKFQFMLRGDLGSRANGGTEIEKRFGIRNQIVLNGDPSKRLIDTDKLKYFLNKVGQVLTGWQQKTPDLYVLDNERFGKCDDGNLIPQITDEKFYTAGACKAGGRVGYSVKLVDGKFLGSNAAELGGKDVKGEIKNKPDSNF